MNQVNNELIGNDPVSFVLNGKPVSVALPKDRTLLWVLRDHLALTGTKYGCGEGECGACTVLLDGVPTRSCLTSLNRVHQKTVTTIEGLAPAGGLHPLQKSFLEFNAMQCGFCTSGMILSAAGLLKKNPKPSREQILKGMEGNICRCGTYPRILQAILKGASVLTTQ